MYWRSPTRRHPTPFKPTLRSPSRYSDCFRAAPSFGWVVVAPKPIADFGDPLPNLTRAQLPPIFRDGLEDFLDEDTAESGLGWFVSCVARHCAVPGGASTILETRFGRLANGHFDPLEEAGGSLLHQSAIAPLVQEVVPHRPTSSRSAWPRHCSPPH